MDAQPEAAPRERRRANVYAAPALLLLLAFTGCVASPTIHHLVDKRYPPRPPDYPIAVLEGDVQEPYLRLATVRTKRYDEWAFETVARADLKRIARKLGGDAVIDLKWFPAFDRRGEVGVKARLDPKPKGRLYYTGDVIRLKRDRPPPLPPLPPILNTPRENAAPKPEK